MTIREAFETILDTSFCFKIDDDVFLWATDVPDDVLGKEIRVVRPMVGCDNEPLYRIRTRREK